MPLTFFSLDIQIIKKPASEIKKHSGGKGKKRKRVIGMTIKGQPSPKKSKKERTEEKTRKLNEICLRKIRAYNYQQR